MYGKLKTSFYIGGWNNGKKRQQKFRSQGHYPDIRGSRPGSEARVEIGGD